MKQVIGVIGLGNIGRNIAATLIRKKFTVIGFDPVKTAQSQALAMGINVTKKLPNLVNKCDVILLALPSEKEVEKVCLEQTGLISSLRKNAIVIDTTTSTPETSRKVASHFAVQDIDFLDAPISGGPSSAATGMLSIMIGGKASVYRKVLPIFTAISHVHLLIGNTGAGNVAKIINNMLAATHLITTSEALALAQKADVDPQRVLEAINLGSGRSGASQAMFPNWIKNNTPHSGCSMGLIRNDVANAAALAKQLRIKLPVTTQAAKLWEISRTQFTDNDDLCCIAKYTNYSLLRNKN